jgi:hypothetical protein
MATNTRQVLGTAFEYIRQEREAEALALLKPIVEAEPENQDAWWLVANAASEPREARRALITLLKLNPTYPKAQKLLEQLNELYPPRDDELLLLMELEDNLAESAPSPLPPAPSVQAESDEFGLGDPFADLDAPAPQKGKASEIDDLFSEKPKSAPAPAGEEDFGYPLEHNPFAVLLEDGVSAKKRRKVPQAQKARSGGRRLLRVVILLLVLSLCVALARVFFAWGSGGDETAPAEPAEAQALTPVPLSEIAPQDEAVLEQTRLDLEAQAQAELGTQVEALYTAQDTGQYAMVLNLCAEPSPNLQKLVSSAFLTVARLAQSTPNLPANITTLGINLQDCQRNNDTLYRAFAPISAGLAWLNAAGDPAQAFNDFRATWRVEN